jgi:enoyl-CoA hydratase
MAASSEGSKDRLTGDGSEGGFAPIERPAGHPLVASEVVEGGVAVLRLADPERRNVLRVEMALDLRAAVAEAVAADVGAIVLTAEPPVYCSGGDLDDLIAPRAPLGEIYAAFQALASAPLLTIAAVDGACVGAGVNLPLACDVALAAPAARFDPRFLDVGIHPGGGHLWRLTGRVGRQGAAALSLGGDVLDGEEAEAKGLVWRCVPEAELLDRALAMGRRAAGRDRELVARTKASIDASLFVGSADEAVAVEGEAQAWSMQRPGFADHVRALKDRLSRRR